MIDLDYLRTIKAVISLQGREYLTHPGLLRVAHENGLKSIQSDLISWDPEKKAAVIRSVVEGERGTFTGYGDACPANVAKHLIEATLRMAETRAINRALRLYTGLGMTTTEELPGDSEEQPAAIPSALRDAHEQLARTPAEQIGCSPEEVLQVWGPGRASEIALYLDSQVPGWRSRDRAALALMRQRAATPDGTARIEAWLAAQVRT